MGLSSWKISVLLSFTAIPLTYYLNLMQSMQSEWFIPTVAFLTFLGLILLTYILVRSLDGNDRPSDPLFYFYTLACFGCVSSMLIALEADSFIKGFFEFYFKHGEIYLTTPFGTLCSYWDGVGHFAMYAIMMRAISKNENYRILGLYWAGSLVNSMIVLLPGSIIGNFGLKWAYLINLPWFIGPILAAVKFLSDRPRQHINSKMADEYHKSIVRRPLDVILAIYYIGALGVSLIRGFSVLGSNMPYMTNYMKTIEPYLMDPASYGKMQGLIYFFYFTPYYLMAIYGLLVPGQLWMMDWSLIHAGAAVNAQLTYIGGAMYSRTPLQYRIPTNPQGQMMFWAINLALGIVPQLIACRCVIGREFFTPVVEKKHN